MDPINSEDADSASPPKERPASSAAVLSAADLGLQVVAMSRGKPIFPAEVLLRRFEDPSAEAEEVRSLQKAFEQEFGDASTDNSDRNAGAARTNASCDYSVDEGLRPVNVERQVNLQCTPISEFQSVERWGWAKPR